jgi:hypothetical protein
MFCILLRPVLPEFHQYLAVYIPFALSKNINLQNPQVLITLLYGTSVTLLHSVVVIKSSEQYSRKAASTSLLSSIIKLVNLLKIGQVLASAPDSSSPAKVDILTAVLPKMEVVYGVMFCLCESNSR